MAPTLADDVVDAGQRAGEHQRQDVLAAVGADDVGGDQGDEQQQRRRHADVLAVRDDLDAVDDLVARDVADADVDDRRDGDDRRAARTAPPSGAMTGAARGPGGSTPCTGRTSPPRGRRAAPRTAGSRGRRPRRRARRRRSCSRRPPGAARPRNTSSREVRRVDRRCSGRPRSAITSRSTSSWSSSSIVTSTSPSSTAVGSADPLQPGDQLGPAHADVDGDLARALEQRVGRRRTRRACRRRSSRRGRTPAARRRAGGSPSAPRCRTCRAGRRAPASPRGPSGSRPAVGSSSRISSGSPTSAWASFVRWRMPVEKPPIGRKRASSRPTRSRMSDARWRAARAGSPLSSPNVDTTSAAVWSSGRQSCSGM